MEVAGVKLGFPPSSGGSFLKRNLGVKKHYDKSRSD